MPLTRDIIAEINKTVQDSIASVFSANSPMLNSIADAVVSQISDGIDVRFKKLENDLEELRNENKKVCE